MRIIRALHKWVGLIAGLQMLLWLASGLVMSLLDHHVVSGDSTAAERTAPILPANAMLVEPQALLAGLAAEVIETMELQAHLGQWLWRIETPLKVQLFDAITGAPVTIDATRAGAIAAAGYAGALEPARVALLTEPTLEARDHAGPLWRVDFNDAQQTRYYVAADDGRIVERRTGDWRIFDVFWMLHTMDYRTRDDFNNPLAVTFAFLSLWLALSGALLLLKSFGIVKRRGTSTTANTRP